MKAAKVVAMANAVKVVAMAAVVVAMAAVANAAKAPQARSAHPAKAVAVAKAAVNAVKADQRVAMNCAKAKPVPHAANVLSVVNAQSGLLASVRPAKAVVMVAAITEMKAEAKTAPMRSLS